jgi:LDH2 family malate/lactate/ureidoglycolate dehydrogenase
MRPVTETKTVTSFAAVSVIDDHDGIGQVVTHRAVTAAGEAASTYGVGVVAVRNSNHFGTAAYRTRILSERGCVGTSPPMGAQQ